MHPLEQLHDFFEQIIRFFPYLSHFGGIFTPKRP